MPFLLLLLLALLSLQGRWPEPPKWLGVSGGVAATAGALLAMVLAGGLLARRQVHNLVQNPDLRASLLPRFHRQRSRLFMLLTVVYLAALFFLGWGWSVRSLWNRHTAGNRDTAQVADGDHGLPDGGQHLVPGQSEDTGKVQGQSVHIWPGLELVLLAPFLAGLLILWALFYSVDRTAHDQVSSGEKPAFPARNVYVALQARHNLLLVIPPLVLVVVQETLFFLAPEIRQQPLVSVVFAIGLLAFALASMPYLLKSFLGLKSLPDGIARQRLCATARRLDFTFRDILLWQTRSTVANAMVTGLFRWNRYIVLTDRLLQELSADEIDAVFGHEVGHAKHHHLWFYIVFILASLAALNGLWTLGQVATQRLAELYSWDLDWIWTETFEMLATLPFLALICVYLFAVFGFVSRRCERQADIFGAKATSCQTFIDALEKVALVNGISRDRPGWLSSWQHATIAQRVDFLRQMTVDPELEPTFQRRLGLVKWALSGCLVAAVIVLAIANSYLTPAGLWEMLRLFS